MKSLADRMKAGIAPEKDKFQAAETAMAAGNLHAAVQPQPAARQEIEPTSRPREQPKTAEGTRTVVRENFSFPPADSELIEVLRKRAAREGVLLNRSEMLRAGLAALGRLSDAEIAAIGGQVPKIKTGRPKTS
jgi:hypothetical protein